MANVNFDREVCLFCPNCGIEFYESQPDKKTDTNIITCGDSESMTGCGYQFIVKKIGFEKRSNELDEED